jgi:hypothetical protein
LGAFRALGEFAVRLGLAPQKDSGSHQDDNDAEIHGPASKQEQGGRETVSILEGKDRFMIRKLASGEYRLYSRKKDPKTGKRRNLGTFKSRKAAEKHERAVQYFKHH